MEKVIKKAIDGGYRGKCIFYDGLNDIWEFNKEYNFSDVFLDPLFWQALGKVEGWKGTGIFKSCLCHENKNEELMEWQLKWHDFIDHLAQGKDVKNSFEGLLK